MPAVPSWAPQQFDLTNPYSTSKGDPWLSFNVQTDLGLFLLDQKGCDFQITVRETTDNVPQSDGSILHRRFLTGVTMPLTIQLWAAPNQIACDDQLTAMLDEVTGAFRSLKNSGDNQGRLAWAVEGANERMLDDVRLLVYPRFETDGITATVTVTIDSQYPFAQDLNQQSTPCPDGVPTEIINTGTADYFPVFQVNRLAGVTSASAVNNFTITLTNGSTVTQFVYSDSFPGADPISVGGHYAEITTFSNTIYLDGDGANLKAGVDELNSEYMELPIGTSEIQIDGCDMDVLWAPAWG